LLAALLLYVVGMMIRQVIAVYAFPFFTAVALLNRRRKGMLYVSVVCCAAVVVTAVGVQNWVEHRIDPVWGGASSVASLRALIHIHSFTANFIRLVTTLLVFLLPATIVAGSIASFSSSARRRGFLWLCSAVFFGVTSMGGPFPQLGNLVTEYGFLYPPIMGFGDRPVVLTSAIRWMITAAAIIFATLTFQMVIDRWEALTPDLGKHLRNLSSTKPPPFFLAVHVLATVAYLVVIDTRSALFLGDRYLLPCLPFLVLLIVYVGNARNWLSYGFGGLAAVIFAAFSLASVHDYANEQAARRAVFERLVARGFAQNEIVIGLEQDRWREIETRGFVDYRFYNPSYSRKWNYQGSRLITLLVPQVATVVGPPGIAPMGVEPVCFRSFLAGRSICVYASPLRRVTISNR
jgi:hypothetical protein